ncbi:hypothetical protein G7Y79_00034g069020 [Physcia stellaris]|nr:hypothetical protein G7Y79_00034g069020 [Physcia stellaris]
MDMSRPTTPVMDPNAILPSPPSSIYSFNSTKSPQSGTTSPSTNIFSRKPSNYSPAASQLPFSEMRRVMGYAQEELEAISFTILQKSDPSLLTAKEIDCAEGVELHWACRNLHPHCPASMSETLNHWLPDIRHAFVHRHKFSALAACKTMYDAAIFAKTMGYDDLGRSFDHIVREMDWCRVEMNKGSTGSDEDLPEDLKKMISGRLQGVLKASQKGSDWEVKDGWKISAEVLEYTFDQKVEENPWADPKVWGHDRNRKYQESASSCSRLSPLRLPSFLDKMDSWRPSASSPVSLCDSTPGKFASSSSEKSLAQRSSKAYVPPAKRAGTTSWTKNR